MSCQELVFIEGVVRGDLVEEPAVGTWLVVLGEDQCTDIWLEDKKLVLLGHLVEGLEQGFQGDTVANARLSIHDSQDFIQRSGHLIYEPWVVQVLLRQKIICVIRDFNSAEAFILGLFQLSSQ